MHNEQPQNKLNERTLSSETTKINDAGKKLFFREIPLEYLEIITGVKLVTSGAPYSEMLAQEIAGDEKRYKELLTTKIKDGVILDLGCGQEYQIFNMARRFGAKTYIGVDLNPYFIGEGEVSRDAVPVRLSLEEEEEIDLNEKKEEIKEEEEKTAAPEVVQLINEGNFNCVKIKGDMLNLISRLKDNSVDVIIISGIEGGAPSEINEKYFIALGQEIQRALTVKGICISYYSDLGNTENTKKLKKIARYRGKLYSSYYIDIYEKNEELVEF